MYVFPKEYDVGGKPINIGFVARNSIDGKWAFSASVMSFRKICQNMMYHLVKSRELGRVSGEELNLTPGSNQLQTISAISKRHTKLLTNDNLKVVRDSIQSVVDSGLDIIQKYRELAKYKLNQEIANVIAKSMPKTITKEIDWIDLDKDKIKFDKKTTQWKAFNDLTEKLTHEGTNFRRTIKGMQVIDTAFGMYR